jgi:hypothetical protein
MEGDVANGIFELKGKGSVVFSDQKAVQEAVKFNIESLEKGICLLEISTLTVTSRQKVVKV